MDSLKTFNQSSYATLASPGEAPPAARTQAETLQQRLIEPRSWPIIAIIKPLAIHSYPLHEAGCPLLEAP